MLVFSSLNNAYDQRASERLVVRRRKFFGFVAAGSSKLQDEALIVKIFLIPGIRSVDLSLLGVGFAVL